MNIKYKNMGEFKLSGSLFLYYSVTFINQGHGDPVGDRKSFLTFSIK